MPRSFKMLFFLILLVLFGNAVTLYYYTSILMGKEQWVTHTFQVMASIESLRADLKTAGNRARSFVISRNEDYLDDYYQLREGLQPKMAELGRLTSDNQSQQKRLADLQLLITENVQRLDQLGSLTKAERIPEAYQYFMENFQLNEVRTTEMLMTDMVNEEKRLLELRAQQSRQHLQILNILVSIILLLDAAFVALIYYVFNKYLTEKRQADQRFRAIFDQAAVGVEEISAQGVIINANPKFCQMLGYRCDELIGEAWSSIVHPDDLAEAKRNDERLFSGTIHSYTIEQRYLRNDGTALWIALTASAVSQYENRPAYRLAIMMDISARKAAEIERGKLLEESQQANRLKDEFLLTVSHELRTPLTIVLGNVELLEMEEPGSAEFLDSIEAIKRGARAQARLVDDLLDISSIHAGGMLIEKKPIQIQPVLKSVIDSYRKLSIGKGILLDFQAPPDPIWILGDEERLQQVFGNLLSNAFKFTSGPGRVTVDVREGELGVMVKISDNGEGISSEFLPHAFEYFRQENSSMTRKHGGLGLGLAIVQKLVELHGGTVQAESQGPSYGTALTVFLPSLNAESSSEPSPNQGSNLEPDALRDRLKGRSLLVIEDEKDSRNVFTISLKMAGAQVDAVGAANEGFALLQEKDFDAIISDISLPEEDGYTLMRRIRTFELESRKKRVKAIALTAHAHRDDVARAREAGYDSHIPKPVSPQVMVERIFAVLGQQD